MRADRAVEAKAGFDVIESGFLVVEPGCCKNGIGYGLSPCPKH